MALKLEILIWFVTSMETHTLGNKIIDIVGYKTTIGSCFEDTVILTCCQLIRNSVMENIPNENER